MKHLALALFLTIYKPCEVAIKSAAAKLVNTGCISMPVETNMIQCVYRGSTQEL